jgi:hypothetical protein
VLDQSPGTVAAYSLRRLSSSYTGNAIRVRRSSDNAEADFTPEQIANGTLTGWVGAGNNGLAVTWYDQSGNGLNMSQSTSANQPAIVSNGAIVLDSDNPTLLLDGSNDSMQAGGQSNFAFGTGDFIAELWVRMTSIQTVEQIFDFRGTADGVVSVPRINLALESNTAVWFINNTIRIRSTTAFTTGVWRHICVSRNGTNTRMFIDGTQEGVTWTDTTNYSVGTDRPAIGRNGADGNNAQFFSGYMDQIRFAAGVSRTQPFTPPSRTGLI